MKDHIKDCSSGQMLIEVVVAIGIIALVLVGVSELMTRSLNVIAFQKQRDEAMTYLQKIQNDYKAQRDSDPDDFYTNITNTVIDPCVAGKPYKCTVLIEKASDFVTLNANAEWNSGNNVLSVSLKQILYRSTR